MKECFRMITLKDIGKFEELPDIAMHIYKGNIPDLQAAIAASWDIEEGIVLSKHITLSPLDLALVSQRSEVVKLLVEHGGNLNLLYCVKPYHKEMRFFYLKQLSKYES